MEKPEEKEVGENEIDFIIEEKEVKKNEIVEKIKEKVKKGFGCVKEKIQACKNGECKCKNKKTVIISIIVVVVLVAAGFGYKVYREKVDIGQEAIKGKVQKFVSENVPETVKTEIKSVTREGHLYAVTVTVDKQEIPLFVTLDGKKLIQSQGVIDLDEQAADNGSKQAQAPEKTEAEVKTNIPTVDLFVMSYCPYGLQMERGVLPAVEALGNKIKFNLKFVGYTLHGQKEVDENVNQYCVQKVAPAKLSKYLQCFWKDSKGTSAACAKQTGVNAALFAACVKQAKDEFKPTEKAFNINKDETVKFGVQGSPTLVINGTTVSSNRDSASVLKAICSGFTTQPKECEKQLSSTTPAAGFTDEALAGGASAASCGN